MQSTSIVKRKLPKLMACMTKGSLENLRNKALFSLDFLDSRGIRRYLTQYLLPKQTHDHGVYIH